MSGDDFEKEVKLALKLVPLDKNDEVVEQLSSDQIQAKYAHLKGKLKTMLKGLSTLFQATLPLKSFMIHPFKLLFVQK